MDIDNDRDRDRDREMERKKKMNGNRKEQGTLPDRRSGHVNVVCVYWVSLIKEEDSVQV